MNPKPDKYFRELLVILRDIHAQKVIHRDIKPANIIRREIDNRLVLIDFGVVKNQVNTVAAGNSNQTALTAFAVGTPGFAPPEQLAMRPVYSSDIYALGVTCMYLMTGKAPKNMDSDPITGEINWFKYAKVSDSFAEILLKMLEVAVKNRYKTAEEVLNDLDLEHHVDSLSESMMSFPTTGNNPNTSASGRTSFSNARRTTVFQNPNTRVSRNSNSASRNPYGSRQQRVTPSNNQNRTSIGRTSTSKTTHFGNPNEKPKPVKLDTESLLSSYRNGRRDFGCKDISMQDLQKAELSGTNFRNSRFNQN